MSEKFSKPWRIEQTDPAPHYVVSDANGHILFYICSDDNPDGEGKPGEINGPTVLGYTEDDDALLDAIEDMLSSENEAA